MLWEVTVGTGVPSKSAALKQAESEKQAGGRFQTLSHSHHRMLAKTYGAVPQPPKMSDLEAQMAEVKMLYKEKYGEDVDEEESLRDEDGMLWEVTVGTGVPSKSAALKQAESEKQAGGRFQTLSHSHHRMLAKTYGAVPQPPKMSDLEAQMAEVKMLYKEKYGEDVEEEESLWDEDGMLWEVTVGTGFQWAVLEPAEGKKQAGGRFQTLSRSHHKMLQRLYTCEGKAPLAPTLSALEKELAVVKALYKQKYGQDVNSEDEQ